MLAYPFTKDEIWNIIKEIPVDKSPRLDGFARCFYKTAWPIIKHDVIRVLNMLAQLDSRSFHHLNNSLMIPKKQEPTMLNGNRSISLINSFSELFSKALADRFRTPETYGQTQPKRFHKKQTHPRQLQVHPGSCKDSAWGAHSKSPHKTGHHQSFCQCHGSSSSTFLQFLGFPGLSECLDKLDHQALILMNGLPGRSWSPIWLHHHGPWDSNNSTLCTGARNHQPPHAQFCTCSRDVV